MVILGFFWKYWSCWTPSLVLWIIVLILAIKWCRVGQLSSMKFRMKSELWSQIPQVLLIPVSSLTHHPKTCESCLKRTADLETFPEHSRNNIKFLKLNNKNNDMDIILSGIIFCTNFVPLEDRERDIGSLAANEIDKWQCQGSYECYCRNLEFNSLTNSLRLLKHQRM